MNFEILDIKTTKKLAKYQKIYEYLKIRIYEVKKELYQKGEENSPLLNELLKIEEIIKK